MSNLSRMQLLRGQHNPIRPPWTTAQFTDDCQRCHACIQHCPEQILKKGRGSFPEVDFSKGECTFCKRCAEVCPTETIGQIDAPWALKIQINPNCLAQQNVVCVTCGEFCEYQAIHFAPKLGGIAQPEVNLEQCTGCGACFSTCPTQAIQLQYLTS